MTDNQDPKFLEVQKEFEALRELYRSDTRQTKFNLLLEGETGMGKTHLLQTARPPVHIDSFDPGGTKHLYAAIQNGTVIVDTRYEHEDPMRPTSALKWTQEMIRREKMGYFNHIGTYALDGLSTFGDAFLNYTLSKAGLAGQIPRFTHDYNPTKHDIRLALTKVLQLPCDVIIVCHLMTDKDEASGRMVVRPLVVGDLRERLPRLFDEIWIAMATDTPKGPDFKILTSPRGPYQARTRIGSGVFTQFEEPNITALLKKAGFDERR